MSANSEFLPPVQSPEDFESLCLDLFREIWEDPNAQKVGRSGQEQKGVDVVGRHAGRQVGVQCKQKDALQGKRGDEDGARADLDEAQEIAERGSMRLFLADVALYRARFFGDREALATARRLVDECGYGRRRAELAILKERWLGSLPRG